MGWCSRPQANTIPPPLRSISLSTFQIFPANGRARISKQQVAISAVLGLTGPEAAAAYPGVAKLWRQSPGQVSFPGGEGPADIQARLLSLLEELGSAHRDETVVLFGHQIVNKVLSCTLLWQDGPDGRAAALDRLWQIEQSTAGIDVFQHVQGAWRTLRLNDTCHLP